MHTQSQLDVRHRYFRDNFNVSIVLPFYKKMEVFKRTFVHNRSFFQRNGIEIIIVMDEPSEEQVLLAFIEASPFINWKVIVNDQPHSWRNPAKAINVGIKQATKKYILVMGPDSEMYDDIIFRFRFMAEFYPSSFFIGRVAFVDQRVDRDDIDPLNIVTSPYGSIFAEKKYFEEATAYNEALVEWGGDDDNIRQRFQILGLKKLYLPEVLLLHREKEADNHRSRDLKSLQIPLSLLKHIMYPVKADINVAWGMDFARIAFNYRDKQKAVSSLKKYLGRFKEYELCNEAMLPQQLNIIALLCTYNESAHITDVLKNLEKVCDGIILLDDSSTDDTYALACSKKLIVKAKKSRKGVDELKARNILLDIAAFMNCNWLLFMDADERFDDRFCDLQAITRLDHVNSVCFYLVHLWNYPTKFRADIPEVSPIGQPGVIHRWRMFRNTGHMQLNCLHKTHFHAIPYKDHKYIAPVLIRHYGNIEEEARRKKFKRYSQITNKKVLPYLLDQKILLKDVSAINQLPDLFTDLSIMERTIDRA